MTCTRTSASYAAGCRCAACHVAEKRRQARRLAAGSPTYQPAEATAARIAWLMSRGLTKRQVCEQSGVDYRTITDILAGDRARVLKRTHDRVMAVSPAIIEHAYIDAAPTARTVARLHRQGYSYGFIADSCGLSTSTVSKLRRNRYCRRRVADAVADFAEFAGRSPGIARGHLPNGRRALSNAERVAS